MQGHAGVPSFAGGGILAFPWGKVAFAEQMTDEEGPYDVLYAADRNDCLSLRGARRLGAPNYVYGHCHPVMWKDGRDGSKSVSFSLLEKETVFGIQRKRGSRAG